MECKHQLGPGQLPVVFPNQARQLDGCWALCHTLIPVKSRDSPNCVQKWPLMVLGNHHMYASNSTHMYAICVLATQTRVVCMQVNCLFSYTIFLAPTLICSFFNVTCLFEKIFSLFDLDIQIYAACHLDE